MRMIVIVIMSGLGEWLWSSPISHGSGAQQNVTIWIALFGLATIGILYMFLSSDQLRRIQKRHEQMQKRQNDLEEKQHLLLEQMGRNLHAMAQETASQTHTLLQSMDDGSLQKEMKPVIERENRILAGTGDLIKFLQIKSHKVQIQNAPFDFNNVLHEVAGTLHDPCLRSGKELIFEVDRNVPKMLLADSLHLTQVLTNICEHLMCHLSSRKVQLNACIDENKTHGLMLEVLIESDGRNINKENFFDAYYDENTQKYIGLDLFVARELTELMGGRLTLPEREGSAQIHLDFPVARGSEDRRQYRLPDRSIMDEKVLIVDYNPHVANALAEYLAYFRIASTLLSAEAFIQKKPSLSDYDILAIDNRLLDRAVKEYIQKARHHHSLRVISLENLYADESTPVEGLADMRMKKPLTQQHVFDVLLSLNTQVKDPIETPPAFPMSLEVYRGDFDDRLHVGLESYARFSGQHILIVEDNIINQKVLEGMLSKSGIRLSIANQGQEALDLLASLDDPVDLIIMDISMPVMDGFVATRKIHAEPAWQSIPIVTLTALVSEHEIDRMFSCGANGYLSKPIKLGRLYSALARFLPSSEAIKNPQATHPEDKVVPDLDRTLAIQTIQNDTMLYREVLREFGSAYGKSDAVFERLIRDARYEPLRILCTDLRGLSGSIGAQGLYEVVVETQTMLMQHKYDWLERLIDPYRTELTQLNDAIERYLR